LFKFSRTTTTISDKIRRFSSFWKLLLIRNVINTKKISYINEQKQATTIDVNNEILINRIESILKRYIGNSEGTINKIVQYMKKLKYSDATIEYELDQVKCFTHVLQNVDEIKKISWDITLDDGSTPSTIGILFESKLQPILNEYFTIFNTVINFSKLSK